jgi:hypothetical protein
VVIPARLELATFGLGNRVCIETSGYRMAH